MKKTALLLLLIAATAFLFVQCKQDTEESAAETDQKTEEAVIEEPAPEPIKIGISKIITHPALDAVEQGVQDVVNASDYEATFDLQNANGDSSTAASIAQKFRSDNV